MRRKNIGRAAMGAITIVGLTVAVVAIPIESPRTGAETWVRSLSEAEQMEFSQPNRLRTLPTEYRGALSRALSSPERRAEFWRNVFSAYRTGRVLSREQGQALTSAESLLTGSVAGSSAERVSILSRLSDARAGVVASLGEDAANELFRGIAPAHLGSGGLPIGERLRYLWRMNRPPALVRALNFVVPSVLAATCNCSDETGCSGHATCGVPELCTPYEPPTCPGFGCGDWGCYGCWKVCYYPN